jgi:hypothetical protein
MKSVLVLFVVLASLASIARADSGADAHGFEDALVFEPGADFAFASVIDLGPVAIAEARRALLADIEDWKDDRTAVNPKRLMVCMLAGAPAGFASIMSGLAVPVARKALSAARLIQRYSDGTEGPSAPLTLPLSELAAKIPFTESERKVLASLLGRATGELTDRIRLAIDTQSFLMKVSRRLYDAAIREQLAASKGFRAFLSPGEATCSAYTLQTDRDTRLIRAADRVLGLYNLLERELRD